MQGQQEAWNRADAQTFAERYAADGSFTNISGLRIYGKPGFVEIHAQIFRTIFASSQISFAIDRLKFLRPDVAVIDVDATLTHLPHVPPGGSLDNDGALHSKLQQLLIKDDGRWSIAAFHNIAVTQMPRR